VDLGGLGWRFGEVTWLHQLHSYMREGGFLSAPMAAARKLVGPETDPVRATIRVFRDFRKLLILKHLQILFLESD